MVVYPIMIVEGACEGALLGLAQSVAFGRSFVPRSDWIRATAWGAAIAWSIGMLPSTLGGVDFSAPPHNSVQCPSQEHPFALDPIVAMVFLLSGLLMAATVAAFTAPVAYRLVSASKMKPGPSG